jgi:hypothetical protein
LVFDDKYFEHFCENCDNKFEILCDKWCRLCQINYLRSNFTNWTSENEKIDDYIQKTQLKINSNCDAVFEWIPYNKFIEIEKTSEKVELTTSIWKDGPLYYDKSKKGLIRISYEKVVLKYLHNSKDITDIINKVLNFSINQL